MCDLLRKNLLLLIWFTKDFEGDSFASSLGIFFFIFLLFYFILFYFIFCVWDLLRKNLLLPYWGYFGEESSTPSLGICFGVLCSIGEEYSASSLGMMLDVLELLRKSLILPFIRIILDTFGKNLLLPSLGIVCLRCLNHWERFLMGLIH